MKTKDAFEWIINILEKNKISYQISGGLAAISYGSKRELFDIDIDVKKEDIFTISNLNEIKEHVIFGPKNTIAANFDVYLITIKYMDQLIDIGASNRLFDLKRKIWTDDHTDFNKYTLTKIFDRQVPTIPLNELIKYKKILSRKEDLEDLKYIENDQAA